MKIKKPTDSKLRRQINNSKVMFPVFYFGSVIFFIIGYIKNEIFYYILSIILMIFASLDLITRQQDKIRLEIRGYKKETED